MGVKTLIDYFFSVSDANHKDFDQNLGFEHVFIKKGTLHIKEHKKQV